MHAIDRHKTALAKQNSGFVDTFSDESNETNLPEFGIKHLCSKESTRESVHKIIIIITAGRMTLGYALWRRKRKYGKSVGFNIL